MPRLVLSSVGTSILGNVADPDEKPLLYGGANQDRDAASGEHQKLASSLRERALERADGASLPALQQQSAELNAIVALDDARGLAPKDMHLLVATDTLYGHAAAESVAAVLRSHGGSVEIIAPSGLTTKSPDDFRSGIKELFRTCGNRIPAYREQGYEIVFNLTGGFKSLQGYLNTVGMLYADRMVYIFQHSMSLIEIPRLPLSVDAEADLKANRRLLLLLDADYPVPASEVTTLKEAFYDVVEGSVVLSLWGTAMWGNAKSDILGDELFDLPHITYTRSFRNDWARRTKGQGVRVRILERLASMAAQWEVTPGERAMRGNTSLQANRLVDKTTKDGNPLFRIRFGEDRLLFYLDDDGPVLLRYLPRGMTYDP